MDDNLNNEINQLHLEATEEEQNTINFNDSIKEEFEPLPREPDKEVIQALNAVFSMAAGAFAPNWNIQAEEIDIVSQAAEVVLDKYMPGVKNSMGCEFALVLAVGGIVLPRLSIPRFEDSKKLEHQKSNDDKTINFGDDGLGDDGLSDLRAMKQSEVENGG